MRSLFDRCRTLLRHFKRPSFLALLLLMSALPNMAQAQAVGEGSLDALQWILFQAAGLAGALAGVLGKIVVAILEVMIPIMQYQGFTTASAVIGGWSIVRDTVNMFFVIVLIVIAFGTIFGNERFKWQQQVPRLMIFAIVINFSKTLCGLMIDFAQVVMLTFANALKDIAGGNFIQLLGLSEITQVSSNASAVKDATKAEGKGTDAFDYFAAGLAAVFMMFWVLTVVFIILAVLVYRIVMLWILIVMAPMAWFIGGVGDKIIHSSAYADWWKNFICYAAIGPVLVFFLWLTLAVAGSGSIAASDPGLNQVFASSGSESLLEATGDFLNKIFELQRLASFIIGMAMLMAGLDAAAKLCDGAKGLEKIKMSDLLKSAKTNHAANITAKGVKKGGELGWKAGKAAAPYAGYAALAAGGAVATGTAFGLRNTVGKTATGRKYGLDKATGPGIPLTASDRAKAFREMGKDADRMGVGNIPLVGTSIVGALNRRADAEQKASAEDIKKALPESYKDESFETKMAMVHQYANMNPSTMLPGTKKEAMARLAEAIKDPKIRAQMDADGTLKKMWASKKDGGQGFGALLKDKTMGTEVGKAFDDFEKGRPEIAGTLGQIRDKDGVLGMDIASIADPEVQKHVASIMSDKKDGSGKYLTMQQAIEQGLYGDDRKNAWKNKRSAIYANMKPKNLAAIPLSHFAGSVNQDVMNKQPALQKRLVNSSMGTWAKVNPEGAAAAMKGAGVDGGNIVDAAAFKGAMNDSSGRFLLKAVQSGTTVDASGGATKFARDISANTDLTQLEAITEQYATASPEDRQYLDMAIDQLRSGLTAVGGGTGAEATRAQQQVQYLNDAVAGQQRKELESIGKQINATIAESTQLNSEVTNLQPELDRYRQELVDRTAELARSGASLASDDTAKGIQEMIDKVNEKITWRNAKVAELNAKQTSLDSDIRARGLDKLP